MDLKKSCPRRLALPLGGIAPALRGGAFLAPACVALLLQVLTGCADADSGRGSRTTPVAPVAQMPTMHEDSAGESADDDHFGNADPGSLPAQVQGPCGDMPCEQKPMEVQDDDGFSVADGDCDDFAELVNPGAYDIPNNGIDEDCDGSDALSDSCDEGLELDADDPLAAARAIELCAAADADDHHWGVLSARWTTPDGAGEPGSALMHGILTSFGSEFAPRGGKAFLALSSGVARAPGQAGYTDNCSDLFDTPSAQLPDGFDGSSTTCPASAQVTEIRDAIALEVVLRVPTNVSALSFDSAFFTDEYPDYVCTAFNDVFETLVDPMPAGASADGNVVFDLDGNAVTVNNSLLRACDAGEFGGKRFDCPLGLTPIDKTGYESCFGIDDAFAGIFPGIFGGQGIDLPDPGASTGWLNTELSVEPGGTVTLRFSIWDSGDGALDSLALIDHVQFRLRDAPPPPDKPMTTPVVVQ